MTRKRFVFFLCLLIFAQAFLTWGDEAKQEHEGGFNNPLIPVAEVAKLLGKGDANHVDLVILHINDTHGRLLPFDAQDKKSVGGIARLATLIKKIRNENAGLPAATEAAQAGRVLVLHAGDIFSRGDTLTVYYGGEVDLAAMNAMDFDAFTPGNGEFYFGIENLRQQTALVRFPTLLANVVYRKDEKMVFQPYIIKDVAGIKVAILGLGFIRQEHPSAWPLILQDPIVVAKKYVPLLRKQADIVIALTHIGLEQDKKLAAEVPQIDIIVGGHSHNQLDTPLRIPKPDGTGEVIVVQAGDYGRFLGRLDIRLQKNENSQYHITKVVGQLLPIDSRIKEDMEIKKLLKRYSEPLEEVLCTSEVTLTNPASGDNPMGNLVIEALRSETDADVALLDRSAVQSGIEPGDITVANVFRIHPWRNRVLKLTLTGAQLQQILTKHDIFTAGCSFQKVEGEVKDLNIGNSPADSKKPYEVVAGEYLVGLVPDLREISFEETGYRVNTILQNYLRRMDVIK